jgi:AraC-like DNA-binding protein
VSLPGLVSETSIVVAALVRSAPERVRLANAVRQTIAVHFVDATADVVDAPVSGHVDAVIVGLHQERSESLSCAALAVRRRFPSVPLVFYLSLDRADVREALNLATTVRPYAFILRGIDDVSLAIGQAVETRQQIVATDRIVNMIDRVATPPVKDVLAFMARNTRRPLCVSDVARCAGVSRRTLFNHFRRADLPTFGQVTHWFRMLHAAASLDAPNTTVEQIADKLAFPSSSALRHLFKRFTGMTASHLRAAGGFSYLLGLAERALRTGTSPIAGGL